MSTEASKTKPTPLDVINPSLGISSLIMVSEWVGQTPMRVTTEGKSGRVIDGRYEAILSASLLVDPTFDEGSADLREKAEAARIGAIEGYLGMIELGVIEPTASTLKTLSDIQRWARPRFEEVIVGSGSRKGLSDRGHQQKLARAQIVGTFAPVNHPLKEKIDEEIKAREAKLERMPDTKEVGEVITKKANKSLRAGEIEDRVVAHLHSYQSVGMYFRTLTAFKRMLSGMNGAVNLSENPNLIETASRAAFAEVARTSMEDGLRRKSSLVDILANLNVLEGADAQIISFWRSAGQIAALTYSEVDLEYRERVNKALELLEKERQRAAEKEKERKAVEAVRQAANPEESNRRAREITAELLNDVVQPVGMPQQQEDLVVVHAGETRNAARESAQAVTIFSRLRNFLFESPEEKEARINEAQRLAMEADIAQFIAEGKGTRDDWKNKLLDRIAARKNQV